MPKRWIKLAFEAYEVSLDERVGSPSSEKAELDESSLRSSLRENSTLSWIETDSLTPRGRRVAVPC